MIEGSRGVRENRGYSKEFLGNSSPLRPKRGVVLTKPFTLTNNL